MNMDELLTKIRELKVEGNNIYKKGLIFKGHTLGKNTMIEACGKYAEGLQEIHRIEKEGLDKIECEEALRTEFLKLKVDILLNIAQSSMFLDSWETILNCCSEALSLQPSNTKAFYRRAKAYEAMNELAKAESDLKEVALLERKQVYYDELEQLRNKMKKAKEKEQFQAETKAAMEQYFINKGKQEDSKVSGETISDEWLHQCGLDGYMTNGDVNENYAWGQNWSEVHLALRIPFDLQSKDVSCVFKRKSLFVEVGNQVIFDSRPLHKPVTVDECSWQLETKGCLHITLYKEKPSSKKEKGEEWWECIFVGEKEIDPLIDYETFSEDFHGLSDKQKVELEKRILADQKSSESGILKREELLLKQQEMVEMERTRRRGNRKAMQDPKKKAIMEMMKKDFPDIPVEFK